MLASGFLRRSQSVVFFVCLFVCLLVHLLYCMCFALFYLRYGMSVMFSSVSLSVDVISSLNAVAIVWHLQVKLNSVLLFISLFSIKNEYKLKLAWSSFHNELQVTLKQKIIVYFWVQIKKFTSLIFWHHATRCKGIFSSDLQGTQQLETQASAKISILTSSCKLLNGTNLSTEFYNDHFLCSNNYKKLKTAKKSPTRRINALQLTSKGEDDTQTVKLMPNRKSQVN